MIMLTHLRSQTDPMSALGQTKPISDHDSHPYVLDSLFLEKDIYRAIFWTFEMNKQVNII